MIFIAGRGQISSIMIKECVQIMFEGDNQEENTPIVSSSSKNHADLLELISKCDEMKMIEEIPFTPLKQKTNKPWTKEFKRSHPSHR